MGISIQDARKTILYLKRNGISNTVNAVLERLQDKKNNKYSYEEPAEDELERQKNYKFEYEPLISILVPCYETKPVFFQDLILSIEDQTYSNYEIVIADASKSNHVERMYKEFNTQYGNLVYKRLEENNGISANTNSGLEMCNGQYIGLLDHDDLITKDCLFRMVEALNEGRKKSGAPVLLYSDEDKTNTYLEKFYDAHYKPRLNLELLLTNNYICHFALYRAEVIKELRLRPEYDGAQDFDLELRTIKYAMDKYGNEYEKRIIHVPYILYHWRCHEESTASNPASKQYAYENGLKAVQAYIDELGVKGTVFHLKHVGFYRIDYDNYFESREDVGVVGGPVYESGKVLSGAMDAKGKALFGGLKKGFSGYMHRAVLTQQCDALDIRNMIIAPKLVDIFKKETGFSYPLDSEACVNMKNEEIITKSLKFCNKVRGLGVKLLYDPEISSYDYTGKRVKTNET